MYSWQDMYEGNSALSKGYGRFEIVKYISANEIIIRFTKTGFEIKTSATSIRNRSIRDPYYPKIYSIGFAGEGIYSAKDTPKIYNLWVAMLRRCYDSKYHISHPSYKGCTVVRKWHNLQNFGADITKMDNWDTPDFQLDKDLRKIGNKKYGPKYCSFVPCHINSIISSGAGVHKQGSKFIAQVSTLDGPEYLGSFTSYEEANETYARRKRKYVREVAAFYKHNLHPQVYKTLKGLPND